MMENQNNGNYSSDDWEAIQPSLFNTDSGVNPVDINALTELISRNSETCATLGNEKLSKQENLNNFSDQNLSCRTAFESSNALTVIDKNAVNPACISKSVCSTASVDMLNTAFNVSDSSIDMGSDQFRYNNQFKWVDKSRRFSEMHSAEQENQSQIEWIKKYSLVDASSKVVKNPANPTSPRRAVLSPDGPSYGFCEVPSLLIPEPPTVFVYEPLAQPDRVFRNEEGTTVKVIKLEDIPKEKRTDISQRKKREVVRLVDIVEKQERPKRNESAKLKEISKSESKVKTDMRQPLPTRHSLQPRKSYNRTSETARPVKNCPDLKDENSETGVNSLLKQIEKLKDESLEISAPPDNESNGKEGHNKKENPTEEKTAIKSKSAPLKNINFRKNSEEDEAISSQPKRSRSYDPQMARDYIKKKRAERVEKCGQEQVKQIQTLQERKNKLIELKKSQMKALKSCVKRKPDEHEVKPGWVGVLEKEDSETELCKGGFGAVRKPSRVFNVHSDKALKIEEVKQVFDRKNKLADPKNLDEDRLKKNKDKVEAVKVDTDAGSKKVATMISEFAQTDEVQDNHPDHNTDLIITLSAQVKELSENIQSFKNCKRPVSPLKVTDTGVQVNHHLDKELQIGNFPKRQKLNLLSFKGTSSKGVQVVPNMMTEIENKSNGRKSPEWLKEMHEQTQSANLINTVKRKLNYYLRLDEERAINQIPKLEPPLSIEDLKLDFSRSSIDTKSKSDSAPKEASASLSDNSFKSVVASLTLNTKNEYSFSGSAAKPASPAEQKCLDYSESYIELDCTEVDKEEAVAIFESVKSDTMGSVSEINVESQSGLLSKSVDTISSHCGSIGNSSGVALSALQIVDTRLKNSQPFKSSEVFSLCSELSKSNPNITTSNCCVSSQNSIITKEKSKTSAQNPLSMQKETSSSSDIPEVINSYRSTEIDSIESNKTFLPASTNLSLDSLSSKSKYSIKPKVGANNLIKSGGGAESSKKRVETAATINSFVLSSSSKSGTTISECLSADPLKLPSSINELKLSEKHSDELSRSKSEDTLINLKNGSDMSNSVTSQTKVESAKPSTSEVGSQDIDSIERYTAPSNNTVTFSPGSLQCRIEDEMNRLNALKLCLNTAIDRNKSLASRNVGNSFKNDMSTVSVTEFVTSEILEENQSGKSEVSTVSIQKSVTLSTNTSTLLAKLRFPEKLKVDYSSNKETTDDTDLSISKFSLKVISELVKDEELRFKHQSALLKLRGKSLFEKTAAELAWLELQRRKEKEKGNDEIVRNIRKKQRGILIKYQEDIDEIKKLFKTEKSASKKRQLLFLQQQQVAKLQMVAKQYSDKKNDDANKASRISVGQSSSGLIAAEKSGKENTSCVPKYMSETCLAKQKRLLEEREATLKVRKEAVEGLVAWKKRLEQEEKRIREMEKMVTGLSPYVSCRCIDRATSPFPGVPESVVVSVIGSKSVTTNFSVSEDLQSQKATSMSQSEVEELPKLSKAIDYYSDSSRLSSAISEHLMSASFSNNEKGSLSGEEKRRNSMVAIKIPLSPRVSRNQRRQSSGSDESILFSQNDTQSEQSDTEVRVCALQQQLRQRKAELERLKRERTKTQRERLRAKEQSLLNQIQAYDAYIERVKSEIKRELDASNVKIMKPQIKQPKVAERRKSDLWLPIEKKKDDSENSSVETVLSPVQKAESIRDSTYMSEDIEQESSENTDSVKTFLESSAFPQKKETEDKYSSRSASVESVSAQRTEEVSDITEKLEDFEEMSECKTVSCSESNSEDKIVIQTDANETRVGSPTVENDISGDYGELNTESSEHFSTHPPSELLESSQKVETQPVSGVSPELVSVHSMSDIAKTNQTTSVDEQEQDNTSDCEPVAVYDIASNEDQIPENEFKYEESFCEEISTNASSLPPSSLPCGQDLIQECDETNVQDHTSHCQLSSEHHVEDDCVESKQIITEEIDFDQALTDKEIEEEDLSSKSKEVDKLIEEIEAYELEDASELSFIVDAEHEITTGIQKTDMIPTEHETFKKEQESEVEEYQSNSLSETDNIPKFYCNQIQKDKEMLASHITDEIMLNILYESFAISEKLWKNNYTKVLAEYNNVSEDTPLLKALQDENKENNSSTSSSATVNSITDKICKVCVEEATEAALKAYFKKTSLHSAKESTAVESATSPVSEVKINKKVGENEGNWLGEEFTAHTSKEAEELRLQQLQIEQEIEELEQATHQVPYYYVREIPNKPPPPYTPPKKAPSKEEVVSRVVSGVSILWEMFVDQKMDISSVEMPADYLAKVEDRMYREFMFDLSREIFLQFKSPEDSVKIPPWQKRFPKKRIDPQIRTKDDLIKLVERQVKVIFGFEPKSQKEKLIIRWSRKKRDHVDEILVRESQEEESEWTDFSVEENILKNEVADSIINKVLQDAVDSLIAAFNNKFKSDLS